MEYERQSSREPDPQPFMVAVPLLWASLDGPVGLRGRTSKVANSSDDQEKVIALLAAIPFTFGGKQDDWGALPLAGSSGSCPQFLADAIWDFQSFWKMAGIFRNIDGVVDPGGNTLRQMNFLVAGLNPVWS